MAPAASPASAKRKQQQPQEGQALLQHSVPPSVIADAILSGDTASLKSAAEAWMHLCNEDMDKAVFIAVRCIFDLASLGHVFEIDALNKAPEELLATIPDKNLTRKEVASLPLMSNSKTQRRNISGVQHFWSLALSLQPASALLDKGLLQLVCLWLHPMLKTSCRSLRHSATVASWAMIDAMTQQHQLLRKNLEALKRQAEDISGRRAAQLKNQVRNLGEHAAVMSSLWVDLLNSVITRCGDFCEQIRGYCLAQLERLTLQDPAQYLQKRWMAQVMELVGDAKEDLRQRALKLVEQWYTLSKRPSAEVQAKLTEFATEHLGRIAERVEDVDQRVSVAALRCLRAPALGESLDDDSFEKVVAQCFRNDDPVVREEAALFVNTHVFQDPGICSLALLQGGQGMGIRRLDKHDDTLGGAEEHAGRSDFTVGAMGPSLGNALNSETCISMLVEFLEGYLREELELTDRIVRAFWGKAPALWHWNTMVMLCLLGESSRTVVEPINQRQRSCLMFLMEACVRIADEEARTGRSAVKVGGTAGQKLSEACVSILPELPRLFEVCRSDEQQMLLLCHITKMLLEHATKNSDKQVLVNSKALCSELRKAILTQPLLDTLKYCVDAMVALARGFDEVKVELTKLAQQICEETQELLVAKKLDVHSLKTMLLRFVAIQNRSIDVTYTSPNIVNHLHNMLVVRAVAMKERRLVVASPGQGPLLPLDGDGQEQGSEQDEGEGSSLPDSSLTLLLLEAGVLAFMWHLRLETTLLEMAAANSKGDLEAIADSGGTSSRSELFSEFNLLRGVAAALLKYDSCHYVKLHAFSAYLMLMQACHNANEGGDDDVGSKSSFPSSSAAGSEQQARKVSRPTRLHFDLAIPYEQLRALWEYLNDLYSSISDPLVIAEAARGWTPDGVRSIVSAKRVNPPAQSDNMPTAQRTVLLRRMQGMDVDEPERSGQPQDGRSLSAHNRLLFTYTASGSVADSDCDLVIFGPLGSLLLTQIDKGRPKQIREVAVQFLGKLLNNARQKDLEQQVAFFRVQMDTVRGLSVYGAAGNQTLAVKMAAYLIEHWGRKVASWMPAAFVAALKELTSEAITPGREKLHVLSFFYSWAEMAVHLPLEHCRDLALAVERHTSNCGLLVSGEDVISHWQSILNKKRGPPGPPPPSGAVAAAPGAGSAAPAVGGDLSAIAEAVAPAASEVQPQLPLEQAVGAEENSEVVESEAKRARVEVENPAPA